MKSFLGLTGYYKRFIKGYANISRPLTDYLKKEGFVWNPEAIHSFQSLKLALLLAPVLALLDFDTI